MVVKFLNVKATCIVEILLHSHLTIHALDHGISNKITHLCNVVVEHLGCHVKLIFIFILVIILRTVSIKIIFLKPDYP